MQRKSLLDRMMKSFSETIEEWLAIMQTQEFWAFIAVAGTIAGFLLAASFMLINFDMMRMKSCFDASNISAYLMFNILMFFAFGGVLAMGEVFNYFDSKKRGIPHKIGSLFWLVIVTTALGSAGLVMLKLSC